MDAVWETFADTASWERYLPFMTGVRWIDGPAWTVGARLRFAIKRGPLRMPFRPHIFEAAPPRRVVWGIDWIGMRVRHAYELEALGGDCRVVSDEVFRGFFVPWLVAPLFRGAVDRTHVRWLDALAAEVARRTGGAA